ncbi:MAG: hypothetical protein AB7T06_09135 [Kofleriaceae bacterium]
MIALLPIGCGNVDDDTAVTELGVSSMGIEGNAPGYGYNAPGYGYNARGYGLNARGYGLNAPGYGYNAIGYGPTNLGYAPSAGQHAFGDLAGRLVRAYEAGTLPWYVVTNELTPIVQPRPLGPSHVGVGCTSATAFTGIWSHDGIVEPIRDWKFARSYIDSSGSTRSSEIWVETAPGAWQPLVFTASSRFRFPAKVSSVGATTAPLDAIVEVSAPPATGCYYECTPSYRVMAYEMKVSLVRTDLGDGQKHCFDWATLGLSAALPAVTNVLTGLQAKGDGWAMLASAHANSAIFKAAHYAQAILDFQHASDTTDRWRYRYPTTDASCETQPASCVDGATVLASYALALTNLIPFRFTGVDPSGPYNILAGHPGTITGQAIYLSATRDNRALRLTDVESPGVRRESDQLRPGTRELASPFSYDSVVGPPTSAHACAGSARAGVGGAPQRVDAMGLSDEVIPEVRTQALLAYNTCRLTSLLSPSSIWTLSSDTTGGGATFSTTAMPSTTTEPACTLIDGWRRRVEVWGARFFCSPPQPPNDPPGTGSGSGSG